MVIQHQIYIPFLQAFITSLSLLACTRNYKYIIYSYFKYDTLNILRNNLFSVNLEWNAIMEFL